MSASLTQVIYFYAAFMLIAAPAVLLLLDDIRADTASEGEKPNVWEDMKLILRKSEIWLAAFCILCGYQLFWATYSFSAYLQQTYGMTAVAVGFITVAKLWMRPIGAISAGVAGDFLSRETVLASLLVAAAASLAGMVAVPSTTGTGLLLGVVMLVGLLTYAVRGIYWATLESCNISDRTKGLAIGVISLIGYAPDIYLPLINAALLERYPGKTGYAIYFIGLAAMGLVGALAAWRLGKVAALRRL